MYSELCNVVYGNTKLTGILDWLLDAIVYVLDIVFQKVFWWLLNYVYEVLIYVPLEIINAISVMLRFFCNGFANWIFGNGQPLWDPSTGKININWSLDSPFGQIVMFAVILGAVMFFIFFLLSFRAGATNSDGKPLKGAWAHAKLLKWPAFMILSLTLLPFIFVFSDALMGNILQFFNGSKPPAFTGNDINNFQYLRNDYNSFFNSVSNTKITAMGSVYSLQSLLTTYVTELQKLKTWAMGQDATDPQQFPAFASSLTSLLTDVNNISKYVSSGMAADKTNVFNIINAATAGTYLSQDNAAAINNVASNLYSFQSTIVNSLASDITDITNGVYSSTWSAVATHNTKFTSDILWNQDQVSSVGTSIVANATTKTTDSNTLYMGFVSMTNLISGENGKFIGLSYLPSYTDVTMVFNVPGIIYSVITGDPNPNAWTDPFGHDFAKKASIVQWALGIFSVWSMIVIVYTYTTSAINRVYYLMGYWILGFLFLANGVTKERQTIGWFKKIFMKWFEVLILMLCFEMACFLVTILQPIIIDALSKSEYNVGGINLLSSMGVVFSLEAGFQVGYLIYQRFAQNEGVGAESFRYNNPMSFLGQGSDLVSSAIATATDYATGGPIKNAFKEIDSYREYWAKKKDGELKWKMMNYGTSKRAIDTKESRDTAKKAGYNFGGREGNNGVISPPEISASGALYDTPAARAAARAAAGGGGGGGGAAPAAGGGGGGAPVAGPAIRNIPQQFSADDPNYRGKVRVAQGPGNFRSKDWYKAATFGERLKNAIVTPTGNAVAWAGEQAHNAAAWVVRRTPIAGMITGVAGIIGGDSGHNAAKQLVGSSKHRITRAEKNWAIKNNMDIVRDTKTGDLLAFAPDGANHNTVSDRLGIARADPNNSAQQVYHGANAGDVFQGEITAAAQAVGGAMADMARQVGAATVGLARDIAAGPGIIANDIRNARAQRQAAQAAAAAAAAPPAGAAAPAAGDGGDRDVFVDAYDSAIGHSYGGFSDSEIELGDLDGGAPAPAVVVAPVRAAAPAAPVPAAVAGGGRPLPPLPAAADSAAAVAGARVLRPGEAGYVPPPPPPPAPNVPPVIGTGYPVGAGPRADYNAWRDLQDVAPAAPAPAAPPRVAPARERNNPQAGIAARVAGLNAYMPTNAPMNLGGHRYYALDPGPRHQPAPVRAPVRAPGPVSHLAVNAAPPHIVPPIFNPAPPPPPHIAPPPVLPPIGHPISVGLLDRVDALNAQLAPPPLPAAPIPAPPAAAAPVPPPPPAAAPVPPPLAWPPLAWPAPAQPADVGPVDVRIPIQTADRRWLYITTQLYPNEVLPRNIFNATQLRVLQDDENRIYGQGGIVVGQYFPEYNGIKIIDNYQRVRQVVSVRDAAGVERAIGVTNGDGTITYY